MSSDLYVRPRKDEGERLSKALRDIFYERICNGWTWMRLDRSFIEGLVAAKVEDADKLLEIYDDADGSIEMKIEN